MDTLTIGIATIKYTHGGKVEDYGFEPAMPLHFDKGLSDQMQRATGADDVESIKNNAEMVMAAWFSKMNEVELADRERYTIESEVLRCLKYPDGRVAECRIKFIFQPLK